jgi:D-3-phosphoglycerate dehydrogenase
VKILVAETFPADGLQALERLRLQVDYQPKVKANDLAEAVKGAAILLVRGRQVAAPVIDGSDTLALIVRAGAGVNAIDVKAASRRGIYVANCPGKNAIAVAELVFGLLLAIDREIPASVAELHAGTWAKAAHSEGRGLFGRTLGVVGLGAIGREVVLRAKAFGMPVIAWSRSLGPAEARTLGVELSTISGLFARADVVSLHLALAPDTRGLVGADLLGRMQKGAILINTARAELIDEEPLRAAVADGRIRLGLDVYHHEPEGGSGKIEDPLALMPGVIGTHHIGASTAQAQAAVADEAVRIVQGFVETGQVIHCVNLAQHTPARCQLVVRHRDRVGVLANVLGALRSAGINAQELQNHIFEGAEAASCRIELDSLPSEEVLATIRARTDEIFSAEVVSLG